MKLHFVGRWGLAIILMAVLAGCASIQMEPVNTARLVPPGRDLYVAIRAEKDRELWQQVALLFKLDPTLSGQISDVCMINAPYTGALLFLFGRLPRDLIVSNLIQKGWVSINGTFSWPVVRSADGKTQIAFPEDGLMVVNEGDVENLLWYANWQKARSTGNPGDLGLGGYPAFLMSDDYSGVLTIYRNTSQQPGNMAFIELGLFRESNSNYQFKGQLAFSSPVEVRQGRSLSKLAFLQLFKIMGIKIVDFSAITVESDGSLSSISGLILDRKDVLQVMQGLVSTSDMR